MSPAAVSLPRHLPAVRPVPGLRLGRLFELPLALLRLAAGLVWGAARLFGALVLGGGLLLFGAGLLLLGGALVGTSAGELPRQ
jgi:hypothetical protein